jgi:hypothetical protein
MPFCECNCKQELTGKQKRFATDACRARYWTNARKIGAGKMESITLPLFEQVKKREGMERSAESNAEILAIFRDHAVRLSESHAEVDIDMVRASVELDNIPYSPGAWMGSTFKGNGFYWNGHVKQSTHKNAHCRLIRVWERK